jgi:hypothetical protein
MHNFFTIETEVEARRQEWERAAAADVRAAEATRANRSRRWLTRVSGFLAKAPAPALPAVPAGAPLALRRVLRPVEC